MGKSLDDILRQATKNFSNAIKKKNVTLALDALNGMPEENRDRTLCADGVVYFLAVNGNVAERERLSKLILVLQPNVHRKISKAQGAMAGLEKAGLVNAIDQIWTSMELSDHRNHPPSGGLKISADNTLHR
jgi:hypothetical protein